MPQFSTASSRWTAIITRDPAASSAFIYSVRSTKIYCRPTCPARLARRANVEFHANAADAEAAGYRACMRCRPKDVNQSAGDPQKLAVSRACELIGNEGKVDGGRKWSVKDLAKEVRLTQSHFCRVFKKVMGSTVGEYRCRVMEKGAISEKEVVPSKPSPATVQIADSPFESQYSLAGLQTPDSFAEFDPELAQDWQDFSGTANMTGTIDAYLGLYPMDPGGLDFSLELLSDSSTPITTDDGFQFLNFDDIASCLFWLNKEVVGLSHAA